MSGQAAEGPHYEAEDQEPGNSVCVCGSPLYLECPGWLETLQRDDS